MDKKRPSTILIVILILGIILVSGCVQQTENISVKNISYEKTIIKPNVTVEAVISDLQNIKNSMNEIGNSLSK